MKNVESVVTDCDKMNEESMKKMKCHCGCLEREKLGVHVLIISHKYGEDVSVYSSLRLARNVLYDYACEWWDHWDSLVGNPPDDIDATIDLYFEATAEREGYEILDRTINE